MNLNFEVKIVEYKLTDLKKEVQQALLFLYRCKTLSVQYVHSVESLIWSDMVNADWVCINETGHYQLTDEGEKLVREHNRRKLKRRWFSK